jgi:2-polyprenyl-6-methoxyphenol hydroxylase-like FAD-dependent oxidoreductase
MLRSFDTSVLIVGAGPVGLTLAMELASRGVDVTVTETRRAGEPPNVKSNQISARSMEIFRRLGLADRIRNTGLPPEYRNDVAMCVSVLGTELSRIKLPSRAGRVRGEKGADGHWPCAEWGHRINQLHLEPLLFAHAAAQPCIRILNRTQFEEFIQDSDVVTAIARGSQKSHQAGDIVGEDSWGHSVPAVWLESVHVIASGIAATPRVG